jgi:hypothetical protein
MHIQDLIHGALVEPRATEEYENLRRGDNPEIEDGEDPDEDENGAGIPA